MVTIVIFHYVTCVLLSTNDVTSAGGAILARVNCPDRRCMQRINPFTSLYTVMIGHAVSLHGRSRCLDKNHREQRFGNAVRKHDNSSVDVLFRTLRR